METFI